MILATMFWVWEEDNSKKIDVTIATIIFYYIDFFEEKYSALI